MNPMGGRGVAGARVRAGGGAHLEVSRRPHRGRGARGRPADVRRRGRREAGGEGRDALAHGRRRRARRHGAREVGEDPQRRHRARAGGPPQERVRSASASTSCAWSCDGRLRGRLPRLRRRRRLSLRDVAPAAGGQGLRRGGARSRSRDASRSTTRRRRASSRTTSGTTRRWPLASIAAGGHRDACPRWSTRRRASRSRIAESDVEDYPGLWLRGNRRRRLSATFPPYPLEEKLEQRSRPQGDEGAPTTSRSRRARARTPGACWRSPETDARAADEPARLPAGARRRGSRTRRGSSRARSRGTGTTPATCTACRSSRASTRRPTSTSSTSRRSTASSTSSSTRAGTSSATCSKVVPEIDMEELFAYAQAEERRPDPVGRLEDARRPVRAGARPVREVGRQGHQGRLHAARRPAGDGLLPPRLPRGGEAQDAGRLPRRAAAGAADAHLAEPHHDRGREGPGEREVERRRPIPSTTSRCRSRACSSGRWTTRRARCRTPRKGSFAKIFERR